jgi:predicted MFS family arabinose efflux permease
MVLLVIGFFNLNMFWGLALIAVSQILLVILVKYEKNQENKTFNFRLLKNRNYTIGNIAAFASYYITHVLTYIITLYLLYVVDVDASIGGLILLITPIVMVITSPIAGQLTNRFDTRSLSAVAMTIILAVLIILIFIRTLPIELLVVAMILQGIGHGIFSPSNNKNVLTCVDDDDLADTSAFLSTSKDMGRTISIGVFNTIGMVVGLNMDNPSLVGDNMLTVSEITIFIFKMQEYHNFCKLWMNCTIGCTVFFN